MNGESVCAERTYTTNVSTCVRVNGLSEAGEETVDKACDTPGPRKRLHEPEMRQIQLHLTILSCS